MAAVLIGLFAFCLTAPNAIEWMGRYRVAYDQRRFDVFSRYRGRFRWRPTRLWAVAMGLAAAFAIANVTRVNEFLYLQF
jgi:hypothetical protein